ncbi:hypothetical protein ERJ77_15530 [Vibrio anguillarum]|uniref:Uncharacterized protein n=1 Tax=Vibrio anguillarum TaxID=55601 RepID=A0AAW4BGL7_VIBAN|nr:hypothetical protein [Vibrio anguillarum]
MQQTSSLDVSEEILLQILGNLLKQDPKIILKNIGIVGAENLFAEQVLNANNSGQLHLIRESIAEVLESYEKSRSKLIKKELDKCKCQLADNEWRNLPSDEKSGKNLRCSFVILVIGFVIGLVFSSVIN